MLLLPLTVLSKVWNAKNGTVIAIQGHKDEVTKACFSPDGKMILTCSPDRTATPWDALTGKIINQLMSHNDEVISGRIQSCKYGRSRKAGVRSYNRLCG